MTTPEDMANTMIANLADKTGRPLPEWLALTLHCGHERHGQLVAWLKREHGITHGFANLIARETLAARAGEVEASTHPIDDLYAGAKAALRPLHDALSAAILAFGDDVVLAPRKANVSVRRRRQFALIQPSTKTRIDVGIQLPEATPTARLEASGSFSGMVSHRVRVTSAEDIDAQLLDWLRAAYDRAA